MRKQQTSRSFSPCYCLNMRRAGQTLTNLYDRHLASSGLTVGQYSILSHLARLEPVSVSGLASAMALERTTLVRNLKPLERKGLIADCAHHGRSRQLVLSAQGRRSYESARLLWEEAQRDLEHSLGKENLTQLAGILGQMLQL